MRYCYTLCVLGLLTLPGCKKKDAEPALLGRWEWVKSKATYYSNGAITSESTQDASSQGPMYMQISVDSMKQYHRNGVVRYAYTRNGNTIQQKGAPGPLTIVELTSNRLTLRYEEFFASGRLDKRVDSEYSR